MRHQLLQAAFAILVPLMLAQPAIAEEGESLDLITDSPEEGFELAISLARKGVTSTQPNKEILHKLREDYSNDADSLIGVSHVIAVHFRTVAEANDYWHD